MRWVDWATLGALAICIGANAYQIWWEWRKWRQSR